MNKSKKSRSPKVATSKPRQRKSLRQPKQSSAAVAYNIPTRNNPSKHGIVVTRDEFVGYVNGSSQFAVTSYPINPGLDAVFPWLSTVSSSFEFYRFKSISFKYIGRGSSSNPGDVIIALDLDPADPPPTSARTLEAYAGRVSTGVWTREPVRMTVNQRDLAERQKQPLYTRVSTVGSTDIKTYDLGNLYVATSGCENTDPIGKLYVEYTVELSVPQLTNNVQSLLFPSGKINTINSTTTFASIPLSQGVSIAQDEMEKITLALTPPELLNTFGAGNVKGILEAVGRLSSSVSSPLLNPLPQSDADPYVLQFEHDFSGRISLDFNVLVLNPTSMTYGVKTRSIASNNWPYATLPPYIGNVDFNYEYPFGQPKVKASTITGYGTTNHFQTIVPGVGNSCSWQAAHSIDTLPIGVLYPFTVEEDDFVAFNGWESVSTVAGSVSFGLKTMQACFFTVHADIDIVALAGQCFSAITNPDPDDAVPLIYCTFPRYVNSSGGIIPPLVSGYQQTINITPTFQTPDFTVITPPTFVSDSTLNLIAHQAKLRYRKNPERALSIIRRVEDLRSLKTAREGYQVTNSS